MDLNRAAERTEHLKKENVIGRNFVEIVPSEKKYGVSKKIGVAIVGVETRYVKHAGSSPVFDSLAALAFAYPPRATFFKSELEQFLLMAREEQFEAHKPLGSYAGAMGRPQFISSSFRSYAVDFDGDGKRDLWNSVPDVIGSVANYFSEHGLQKGDSVTHPAVVKNTSIVRKENTLKPYASVDQFKQQGVSLEKISEPKFDGKQQATLLKLEGKKGDEYWLVFGRMYRHSYEGAGGSEVRNSC